MSWDELFAASVNDGVEGPIYHVALRDEWSEAVETGTAYQRSTLGRTLEDVGFIHCSFAHQIQGILDAFYAGCVDVVLLEIDPRRLAAAVRVEKAPDGPAAFPHIYGPLPLDAVTRVIAVPPDQPASRPG